MSDLGDFYDGPDDIEPISHLELQIVEGLSDLSGPRRHLRSNEPIAYLIHRNADGVFETVYAWYSTDGNSYHAENTNFERITGVMELWLAYNSFADGEDYNMGLVTIAQDGEDFVGHFDPCFLTKHFGLDHIESGNLSVIARKMNPIVQKTGAFGL